MTCIMLLNYLHCNGDDKKLVKTPLSWIWLTKLPLSKFPGVIVVCYGPNVLFTCQVSTCNWKGYSTFSQIQSHIWIVASFLREFYLLSLCIWTVPQLLYCKRTTAKRSYCTLAVLSISNNTPSFILWTIHHVDNKILLNLHGHGCYILIWCSTVIHL